MEDYSNFLREWIRRSGRKEGRDYIDIGDKFISLWIAFNGWMKSEFGEKKWDKDLKDELINFSPMEVVFNIFKNGNNDLALLAKYKIKNMRDPENEKLKQGYDGSFKSLIEVLYSIRCNLFHGRKNVTDNENDKELVGLAYKILSPLFKKYLEEKN
jgi:hypothetical protein